MVAGVVDVGEQRRRHEPALIERPAGRSAPPTTRRAPAHARPRRSPAPGPAGARPRGADLGRRVVGAAHHQILHHGGEGVDVLGGAGGGTSTRVWATQARPLFMRPATHAPGHHRRVGVVGDDGGGLAAQLEAHPLLAGGGDLTRRPGEVHAGARRRRPRPPGRNTDHARRQVELLDQLGEDEGAERRLGLALMIGQPVRAPAPALHDQELRHVPRGRWLQPRRRALRRTTSSPK